MSPLVRLSSSRREERQEWNYARLSDTFSHIHDLSRTRVESRSIHVFGRDRHLGLGSQIISIHFRWYSYRPEILVDTKKYQYLALFFSLSLSSVHRSVFIECKLERASTQLFSRANILACSRASSSPLAFRSIFFFSLPFIFPVARAGPIFPSLFLSRTRAGNVHRARIRWWVSLDDATQILSFDPRGQNCNIAREEETDRGIGSLFSACIFAKKKKITDAERYRPRLRNYINKPRIVIY